MNEPNGSETGANSDNPVEKQNGQTGAADFSVAAVSDRRNLDERRSESAATTDSFIT